MSSLSVGSASNVLLGLKLYELLTLAGIVIGPVVAVVITLVTESWRQMHDSQMRLLQTLITTRATPAIDQWSMAVNMIPIVFRHREGVISRWKDYVITPAVKGSQDEIAANGQRIQIKQIAMIHAISTAMGLKITEGDLQATAYYSKGLTDRDQLLEGALASFPVIAENTSRSANAADAMIRQMDFTAQSDSKNTP